jgi:peptidoglycan hydrolase-like protein with peptidoglycan-binding domain
MSARDDLVALAKSTVPQHAHFTYEEIRPMRLSRVWPWVGDCSTFVTWLFWMLNLPDPNQLGYNGIGNTQSLYAKGTKISSGQVQPGDVVVYNATSGLTTQHTALVVEGGPDPLTVSMGQQGDPSFVHVSQDGRTPFYVRFLPADPAPTPTPKPTPKPDVVTLPDLGSNSALHGWVEDVQALLVAKFGCNLGTTGLHANGVDGIAGPLFVGAVKQIQTAHRLPVTGVVDSATWAVLLG